MKFPKQKALAGKAMPFLLSEVSENINFSDVDAVEVINYNIAKNVKRKKEVDVEID